MSEEIMVGKALETNSFQSTATSAGYINPTVWVRMIEDFAKAKVVVAPLGVVYNELLGAAGDSLNVQFSAEISAAALTESTALTASAITYTQRTFTPTEYGVGIAITRKERIRSINDIMADKTRDMGYALAKKKDQVIFTELVASAGNTIVANSVVASALTTTDTLDTGDIANAISTMRKVDYQPKYIILHPACENSLLKASDFVDASVYGGREVVMNGEIGKYLGLKVLTTTLVPTNSSEGNGNAYDNFVLGDRAFGIANKMGVTMDGDYDPFKREYRLAAVEEYNVKALHTNAIVKLSAYKGA